MSRAAQVADAAFVIERLGLHAAVVVRQSIGGLTALSLAARRPELVDGLVVVDASPGAGVGGIEENVGATEAALRAWPLPFAFGAAAEAFFAERFGSPRVAEAWAADLMAGDGVVAPESAAQALPTPSTPSTGAAHGVRVARCPTRR